MSELRDLLAGPIVRRAGTDEICIWLCFSFETEVTVRVLASEGLLVAPRRREVLGEATTSTIAFALHLHLALVRVRPANKAFPKDRTLAYEVEYVDPDGATTAIDHAVLSYAPFDRPTFVLRSGYPVNVLHGSCRKPHGGKLDALVLADTLLADAARTRKPLLRPSALFLTGDQIYGDDVPDAVGAWLPGFALRLAGEDEKIPVRGGTPRLSTVTGRHRKDALPPAITADDGVKMNHAIGFCEYAALYLYAWHPSIGPRDEELFAPESRVRVRRALANIATYMMCDDHDVTDDWNRTRQWEKNVEKSPLATRIVWNAHAAMWAFQLWGNAPKDGDVERAKAIAKAIGACARGNPQLLISALARDRYHFITPMFPRVIVLDTRTHRVPATTEEAPQMLLDAKSLGWLAAAMTQLPSGDPVVIVSPAPVVNFRLYAAGKLLKNSDEADLEDWDASVGVYRLKEVLAKYARDRAVIVLSGDVHFAYTMKELFDVGTERTLNLVQFTSSALKNRPTWFDRELVDKAGQELMVGLGKRMLVFETHRAEALKRLEMDAKRDEVLAAWMNVWPYKLVPVLIIPERIRDKHSSDATEPDFAEYRQLEDGPYVDNNLGQLEIADKTLARVAVLRATRSGLRREPKTISLVPQTFEWKTGGPDAGESRKPVVAPKLQTITVVLAGFDVNEAEIPPELCPALNVIADMLIERPDTDFEVHGHASQTGLVPTNEALATRRAEAVCRYLRSHGVPREPVKTEGHGFRDPREDAPNVELLINRRVEIKLAVHIPTPITRKRTPESRRWSIKLHAGSELFGHNVLDGLAKKRKVIELSAGLTGALTIGRLRQHADTDEPEPPVVASRVIVMPAAGVGLGLGLQIPLKKEALEKLVEAVNSRLPAVDIGGYNAFATRQRLSFLDFHNTLFSLMNVGGGIVVIGNSLEELRFPMLDIVGGKIDTGGWTVGGQLGASLSSVVGITGVF